MAELIKLAISTCPNDTFAFHAIINKKIDLQGLDFRIQLMDIALLNQGLMNGQFDVAKASFYAALKLASNYIFLAAGAAIGFGNGPLLLAAKPNSIPTSQSQITLCPGKNTTATMLFRMFYGQTKIQHVLFSEIMPALQQQQADFGVCIHEGRFTFEQSGLTLVEDLGKRWEQTTGFPLPLGGILASKSLPNDTIAKVQNVISESVRYALSHREETVETMRKYAQEFDDRILFQHVDLYVNDWTVDLGSTGRQALKKLNAFAIENMGDFQPAELTIFGDNSET